MDSADRVSFLLKSEATLAALLHIPTKSDTNHHFTVLTVINSCTRNNKCMFEGLYLSVLGTTDVQIF